MARRRSGVTGHKQARANLRKLASVATKPIGAASRFALVPMRDAAKKNLKTPKPGHPDGNYITGELHDSLKVLKVKRAPARTVQYHVTASGKGIRKAHLVEFGTDPHWQPKRGVMHPGARPFPFMTPAFEEREDEAIKRFGEKYGDELEAEAAKLGRRR